MNDTSDSHLNLGNGLKFGVDYLGYKGKIEETHSNYIITVNKKEKISMLDIIKTGRVAANTNKTAVICNEHGDGVEIDWKMRDKM